MRLQCNFKGPELFLERGGGGAEKCAKSLRPGSMGPLKGPGSSGVIDAL